jgi:hypothetical protein
MVKAFARQYQRGRKKEKGEILDGFVEQTGYQRRYAARLLRNHGRVVRAGPGVVLRGDVDCRVKRTPSEDLRRADPGIGTARGMAFKG